MAELVSYDKAWDEFRETQEYKASLAKGLFYAYSRFIEKNFDLYRRSQGKLVDLQDKIQAKIEFLKEYEELFLNARDSKVHARVFGNIVRDKLGYSKKTYVQDIIRSLETTYDEFVKSKTL